ncbi:putative ribonuclease H-like domain-containing protein [Rosa chinensis]|uniref:Putative ribonuclease H-like domain-containing protein n=1 Tax=Rosa chinensis TaxID=74649 RepID=A0A2P6RFX0_ROSCH|nr:putative ribonuclease H-like domain-containing protein [Rosa chinensis]
MQTSSVTLQGGQHGGVLETGQQFEGVEPRLFFDGAVDVLKGCVGLGAVILSGTGQLMGAMSIPLPVPINPIAAEALALRHALEFGRAFGVRSVRVYGDALNVLNGLNASSSGWDLSAIGGVLDAVRLLMREFEMISWKHVKKRSNLVAHKLARSALSLVQAMFCKDVGPPWLHDLIDDV